MWEGTVSGNIVMNANCCEMWATGDHNEWRLYACMYHCQEGRISRCAPCT